MNTFVEYKKIEDEDFEKALDDLVKQIKKQSKKEGEPCTGFLGFTDEDGEDMIYLFNDNFLGVHSLKCSIDEAIEMAKRLEGGQ
jgi:hypothetical protein